MTFLISFAIILGLTAMASSTMTIQLTSIKYFTNKLEKLVIIAQKENAQVIIPKI